MHWMLGCGALVLLSTAVADPLQYGTAQPSATQIYQALVLGDRLQTQQPSSEIRQVWQPMAIPHDYVKQPEPAAKSESYYDPHYDYCLRYPRSRYCYPYRYPYPVPYWRHHPWGVGHPGVDHH